MAFTRRQIGYIQSVRRKVASLRDDDLWRLVLRQTGCKRDKDGVPTLTHQGNGHEAFETIMHRLSMNAESDLDEAEWRNKVFKTGQRMRHALANFYERCAALGLCQAGALEGLCERMTARRPEYLDKPATRNVADLDVSELIHLIEGFKAWMRREAGRLGLTAPKFGGAA